MTVLEASLKVLADSGQPMNVKQILYEIEARNLYAFKAKDPAKVVSSAIRNNLRNAYPPALRQVENGHYVLA